MRINQNGFGAVGILIIIVVICILGFAGWYVRDQNQSEVEAKKETSFTSEDRSKKESTTNKNTPEQNAEIEKQAVQERDHEKCEQIKGETKTGNPVNLSEPLMISEEKAKGRCHNLIDWWNDRDQQNKNSQ